MLSLLIYKLTFSSHRSWDDDPARDFITPDIKIWAYDNNIIQNFIKINYLNYSSTKKNYNFGNCLLQIVVLRDIYKWRLSINDADEEESMFHHEKRAKHDRIPDKKANSSKGIIFPMKVMGKDGHEKNQTHQKTNNKTMQK